MTSLLRHGLKAQQPRPVRLPSFNCPGHTASAPFSQTANNFKSSRANLTFPEPPTRKHKDLDSFLAHAERSDLDPNSTIYVGTHYEYTVAQTLSKYRFYLRRIGGKHDYGTDLLGTWTVPSYPEPLKVLIQCKAIARKSAPNLIRELEGAFVGAPVGWRGHGVVGIFVTEKPATKGVRDSLARSKWPMGFVSCTREGRVQQLLWNQRAEEEGLEGLGVGVRYSGGEGEPQLLLTWRGKHLGLLKGSKRKKSERTAKSS